ncbi:hypothetical protein V1282_006942 [Nitrobacteraceae bacterium AZCC 2146]
MSAFYLPAAIQFAAILFLGLPLAAILMIRDSAPASMGWPLLAPALGTTVYLSVGTILHSFGLQSIPVFWILIILAAIVLCVLLARTPRALRRVMWAGIAVGFAGAASAFVLNSTDLQFAGLDYFPLTNDDTFSYLGLIDQLRSTGWIEPRIAYPAGFFPLIEHAVYTRTPGMIFVADFAELLGLETHSSFFLAQRLALPIIVLGASGVVILVTRSLTAALLCLASLIFGNVLLHQILHQFNSSTMGTAIAPVIIAAAIWAFRPVRSERGMVAGCALAGWACGTLAITSMGAHPFYLIAFGAVAVIAIASDRLWVRAVKGARAFVILYLVSSFPFVLKIWPAMLSQFANAGSGHPGDWIATSGFLMQATGVTFTTVAKLSAYPVIPQIVAISVLVSVLLAIVVLAWGAVMPAWRGAVLKSDLVALACVALLLLLFQTVLYAHGSGYSLLKITDYFAFVGAMVVSVAAFQLGLTRNRLAGGTLIGLIGAYCVIAFIQKQELLERYRERTALAPLPAAYRLDQKSAGATLVPDLMAEPLNMFLYENRYGAAKIAFRDPESNRYRPIDKAMAKPDQVARMFVTGTLGTTVADITYPAAPPPPVLDIAPLIGQTRLVQPDHHWLGPEGAIANTLWRWLSVSGRFLIYGPLARNQRTLAVDLAPGPDLHSDNRIEFYVSGQHLLTISPGELPRQVTVPLPALSETENEAEIRIVGPAGGIHQLSVAKLLSFPR